MTDPLDFFNTNFPMPSSSSLCIASRAPSRPPLARNFFFLLTSRETSSIIPGRERTNASLDCCKFVIGKLAAEPGNPLDSPTYPTWDSGIGWTVGYEWL